MKYGQLIEYNMKNIFLKKSHTEWGGEAIPRPFPKKSKLSISLAINSVKFEAVFIVCLVKDYGIISKLSYRLLAFFYLRFL